MSTHEKALDYKRHPEKTESQIMLYISQNLRNILKNISFKTLEEIRLRADKPLMVQDLHGDWFVQVDGSLSDLPGNPYVVRSEELLKTLELMSNNSIYAYQEEIRKGYITLMGGHRIGISGRVVHEAGNIRNIKDVSGINIRISREISGCSNNIIRHIVNGKNDIFNTLIISPPQCGKTTILRDLARILSDGDPLTGLKGMKIGVVDERSEIAACYRGVPQYNVGLRTDVLDACPKYLGMEMLLRSMSPKVIITDEIGNEGDREAILQVVNAGVKIIASAHGFNISELRTRLGVLKIIEAGIFERYVVLSGNLGPGTLEEVIEGPAMVLVGGRRCKKGMVI